MSYCPLSSVLWGGLRLESARLVMGSMAADTEFSPFLVAPFLLYFCLKQVFPCVIV